MRISKMFHRTKQAGLAVGLVISFMLVSAASGVEYQGLGVLDQGLVMPEDVAVAPDGSVYVVDGRQGAVLNYSSTGEFNGTVEVSDPVSVAVASDATIYIGTRGDYAVHVIKADGSRFSLGSGAGEFNLPRNIAVHPVSGDVYVVDQVAQLIKVYDANGNHLRSIDDSPNLPQDIAIAGDSLYVIDQPMIIGDYGGMIRGARVQVYDLQGNPISSFGTYGSGEGQFVRPKGITADSNGVLYITDSFHGVVQCFDPDGNYLNAIREAGQPMLAPQGVAFSADGRLFVAASFSANVQQFGIPSAGYDGSTGGSSNVTVYEDGEDGLVDGWDIYDNRPAGATVTNIFDGSRQGRVIDLAGTGTGNGYRLKWSANSSQFVAQWSMNFSENFYVYFDVETSAGHRYLTYRPVDHDGLGSGTYVYHGLGSGAIDGRWHTYSRDLQADLSSAQPGVTITSVNGILIRGSGMLDDIQLLNSLPAGLDSDGDGISDADEVAIYGTDPSRADTDGDGIDDGTELTYWGVDWSTDYDNDGMNNLQDLDSDNDGTPDGEEINRGYDPGNAGSLPGNTVYEGAGGVGGWQIYDTAPSGAAISTVFDATLQADVVVLAGAGQQNGYRLRNADGSKWNNRSQFIIQWSMNYAEAFTVYIDVETSSGHRYLTYRPVDYSSLGNGGYVYHGLGEGAIDGKWHTYSRDLQADLSAAQPGVSIIEVNAFLIRGSGLVNDVQLLDTMPTLPGTIVLSDGEDGSATGWSVYDSSPSGASIANVYDAAVQSRVIELSGNGTANGYRLRNADGSKLNNSSHMVVEWSMQYSEDFYVYIDVETTAGHRYLTYRPVDYDGLGSGGYVYHGLGSGMLDGNWYIVSRDLQADLSAAQPGVSIIEVNGFLVRGNGRIDDVKLLQ